MRPVRDDECTSASERVRADLRADTNSSIRLSFPKSGSILTSACLALPLAATAIIYGPYATHSLSFVFVALTPLSFFAVLIPIEVLLHYRDKSRGVILDEEGISREGGRYLARWGEITSIRKAWPRISRVCLILGARHYSKLARIIGLTPKSLYFPPCPSVFRHLLPAVLARRPEISVSRHARRWMANPEAIACAPRWSAALLLVLGVAVMLIPALVRSDQRFWLLLIVGGVYGLVFLLILLLFPSTQISRRSFGFAHAASCSSMSVFYPLMLHDMLDAPLYALDAVVALLVVLVLGGAMVVALDAKLKALHEAAILMCAIGAASLFYVLGAAGA